MGESFHRDNGQTYSETTSSRVTSMVPMWRKHVTGRRVDPQTYKNKARGSSTLRDMAMRSCCWNAELFTPEALYSSDWHYAGQIYQRLKETDTLTFIAWELFQRAYPDQPELSHRFRVRDCDTIESWPSIVRSLSVLNKGVLTHFCAYGIGLGFSQFMSLINISTLAALVHVNIPPPSKNNSLTGRGFRDWIRAVLERGALGKLRLLFISLMSEDGSTNANILNGLTHFPTLSLVGIAHAWRFTGGKGIPAVPDGWSYPKPHDEAKYTEMIWDPRLPIAVKTERLYGCATEVVPLQSDASSPVTLSLTCAALGPDCRDRSTAWFIREPVSTDTQQKWPQESQTLQNSDGRATKRRKVRQRKQQDVGSLLETFF